MVLTAMAGRLATASNFSFAGSLTADNSVQLFSFTVAATATVTLQTYSYAGGTNQFGTTVPSGGFDPILSLFDSSGLLINENDDGYANVPADARTGQHWDSYIHTTLAAGTYTVSLTQYDNFPQGSHLSDEFSRAGQPQFTGAFGCSNGEFCDRTGNNRTAGWEFDVQDTASAAAVPESNMSALIFIGIAFMISFRGYKAGWKLFVHARAKNFKLSIDN
jgi:hypothetical protein